jgi:hypothetical protein
MKQKSTTRRDLLRLRSGLLVLTVLVFAGSLATFTGVMSTVRDAAARTAPAVLEVMAARWALVQADSAAMTSFQTGQGQLIGPGETYQDQMAIASQNLAQVAEHNSAGATGSADLQLVEGLVVSYGQLIGNAHTYFREDSASPLGAAELSYASGLMHGPDSGIVAKLDQLARAQHQALGDQLSQGWMNSAVALVWILPIALLLLLLGYTQYFTKTRFSRTLNPALAVATLLLVLVFSGTAAVFGAQGKADTASESMARVVTQWDAQTRAVAVEGQRELAQMIRRQCGAGCGVTADAFIAKFAAVAPKPRTGSQSDIPGTKQVDEELSTADKSGFLDYSIPLAVLVIAGLVFLGLQRGIDEYRYRTT